MANPFGLGRLLNSNNGGLDERNQSWIGVIDEFCLYDRALSEDEIKQNYGAEGLAVNPSGKLSAVWGRIKNLSEK